MSIGWFHSGRSRWARSAILKRPHCSATTSFTGPGESGHETWAGDSWKIGRVGVWVTGAYDPEQNLLFYGTGNPGPDYHSESREGDNLYSTSLVALDADTGDLRWHYQFTPHV